HLGFSTGATCKSSRTDGERRSTVSSSSFDQRNLACWWRLRWSLAGYSGGRTCSISCGATTLSSTSGRWMSIFPGCAESCKLPDFRTDVSGRCTGPATGSRRSRNGWWISQTRQSLPLAVRDPFRVRSTIGVGDGWPAHAGAKVSSRLQDENGPAVASSPDGGVFHDEFG